MRTNHLRLITLGRLALVAEPGDEESLTKRRRHLAVLAVLALSPRPVGRALLVDMFWGDEEAERARHSLSNALSSLRRLLGASAIATRQSDVSLSVDSRLRVDAIEFASACELSNWGEASGLYSGQFLDGVAVPNSPRFDAWVTRERARFERLYLQACETHCAALAHGGQSAECAAVATRWLEALPPSRAAATALLTALASDGTKDALREALAAYDRLSRRLEAEYESPPDPRVAALAAGFRDQLRHAPDALQTRVSVAPEPNGPASIDRGTGVDTTRKTAPSIRTGRLPGWMSAPRIPQFLALAIIVVGTAAAVGYRARLLRHPAVAASVLPRVAVTNVTNVRSDSSIAWLEDGLERMISADLSHSDAVDVVAPSRVHDVVLRAGYARGVSLSPRQANDIARRVNATWSVTADLSHGSGGYVLGLNVYNAVSGKLFQVYTFTGSDIMSLVDAASARILDVVGASNGAPQFADIETSSSAAYRHFIRGMEASASGQYPDDERELDAALALDPGFVSAITARRNVALRHGEIAVAIKMDSAFARHIARASRWDRMLDEASRALHSGGPESGEALSRNLVKSYPSDPRSYVFLADVLMQHGKWLAADSVLIRELALDSLAVEAGHGPCAPCLAYHGLTDSRIEAGDFAGAERSARAWVALQPELPDAWQTLANALAMSGRPEMAIGVGEHAASLTVASFPTINIGRWMIMDRRYDAAEQHAEKLLSSQNPQLRDGAGDILAMVARERGQLRLANRIFARIFARGGPTDAMHLLHADDLARLGDFAGAKREFSTFARYGPSDGSLSLRGDEARAFTWPRALEADALAASGDTALLKAVADSIQTVGARSYYGRDWMLFSAARWGYAGWTRTVAELAAAQLAQGHSRDAITTLRRAYSSAPDAMGRYMPRSELDLRMSNAFRAAGMTDSARVYRQYVEIAWKNADPEVKRLLASPPEH